MSNVQIQVIKGLLKQAFEKSVEAKEILIDDVNNNELIAGMYLDQAISIMHSAKTVYDLNQGELKDDQVDEIFNSFAELSEEFNSNLKTNHSQQWTFIMFDKYQNALNQLPLDI